MEETKDGESTRSAPSWADRISRSSKAASRPAARSSPEPVAGGDLVIVEAAVVDHSDSMSIVASKRGHGVMSLEQARARGALASPSSPQRRAAEAINPWEELEAEPELVESPRSAPAEAEAAVEAPAPVKAPSPAKAPPVETAPAAPSELRRRPAAAKAAEAAPPEAAPAKAPKAKAPKVKAPKVKAPKAPKAPKEAKAAPKEAKHKATKTKKKRAADDAALFSDVAPPHDSAADIRERTLGCLSVVLALLVWGWPTAAFLTRPKHEFSAERFKAEFPRPSAIEIVTPAPEQLATESGLEWVFGDAFTRACGDSSVDVEVWLDRGLVLGGDGATIAMPPVTELGDGKVDPFRLTYDLGPLAAGIHNATVVVRSTEVPPKFQPVQNTSLFASTTVGGAPPRP